MPVFLKAKKHARVMIAAKGPPPPKHGPLSAPHVASWEGRTPPWPSGRGLREQPWLRVKRDTDGARAPLGWGRGAAIRLGLWWQQGIGRRADMTVMMGTRVRARLDSGQQAVVAPGDTSTARAIGASGLPRPLGMGQDEETAVATGIHHSSALSIM